MKIYQCDFCKEEVPCTQTVIDNRSYDICYPCKDERDAQLKDRGEPVRGMVGNSFIYHWPYPTNLPPTVTFTNAIGKTLQNTGALTVEGSSTWNTDYILDN